MKKIPYLFEEDHVLKQERFEPASWTIPIEDQLKLIREKYFPDIEINSEYLKEKINCPIPSGFTKIVIPKIDFLARHNNIVDPYSEIGPLIENVCSLLTDQRLGKFTHYRKGQLGKNRIRCIQELANRRESIEAEIPGDILILDVDMGNAYAGWTPRRAREHIIFDKSRFALSAVDIGWILLINPNRFQCNTDLSVDSVLEEYYSEDRGWVTNLFFYYRGGKLEFGYRWNRRAYFDAGAAIAVANNR